MGKHAIRVVREKGFHANLAIPVLIPLVSPKLFQVEPTLLNGPGSDIATPKHGRGRMKPDGVIHGFKVLAQRLGAKF